MKVRIWADVSATVSRSFEVPDGTNLSEIDYTKLFFSENRSLTDEEDRNVIRDPYVDPYEIQEDDE